MLPYDRRRELARSGIGEPIAAERGGTKASGILGWMPTPLRTVFTGIKRALAPAEEPELEGAEAPSRIARAGLSLDEAVQLRDVKPSIGEPGRGPGFGFGGASVASISQGVPPNELTGAQPVHGGKVIGRFSPDLLLEDDLDGQNASAKPAFLHGHDRKRTLDRLRRTKRRIAPFHANPGSSKGFDDGWSFMVSPSASGGEEGSLKGLPSSSKPMGSRESARGRRAAEGGSFRSKPFYKKLKISEDRWEGKALTRMPIDRDLETMNRADGKAIRNDQSEREPKLKTEDKVDINRGQFMGLSSLGLRRRPAQHLPAESRQLAFLPKAPRALTAFVPVDGKEGGDHENQGALRLGDSEEEEKADFDLPVFKSGFSGADAEKNDKILKLLLATYPHVTGEECESEVVFVNQKLVIEARTC